MFKGNNRILVVICAIILMAVVTLFVFSTLSARAADSIKLGAILSITGPGSFIGIQVRNGLVLAVDEINSYGGINGRKIELVIVDSKSCPNEGRALSPKWKHNTTPCYISQP